MAGFQDVIDALREKGWMIPDEVSDYTELVIAIKAQGQPQGGFGGDDYQGDTDDDGNMPSLMSHTRVPHAQRNRVSDFMCNGLPHKKQKPR